MLRYKYQGTGAVCSQVGRAGRGSEPSEVGGCGTQGESVCGFFPASGDLTVGHTHIHTIHKRHTHIHTNNTLMHTPHKPHTHTRCSPGLGAPVRPRAAEQVGRRPRKECGAEQWRVYNLREQPHSPQMIHTSLESL